MHDKGISSAVEQDNAMDHAILGLLVIDHPGLWSVEEVERMMGDPLGTADGLNRLARVGLIHRLGGFVFASRSACAAALRG